MCIIQLFIPIILSVVECLGQTGCLSSVPTVSNVHRCPGNVSEWVKASERKRCSLVRQNCSSDSEFQYHCLINAEINGMVEVCIPIRRIVGSFCPFYDSKKARIENHYHLSCKEHKFNCPEHYQSNEAYKYQGCYSAVFGQEFTNKTKRGENVNDIQIFQKIGDKMVDIQKDTFWTVVAIVCAVVFLMIFGVLSMVLKFINIETKNACMECWPRCYKCCYKVDSVQNNSMEMKENDKENKENDKEDKDDTNERLLSDKETGSSDNS